MGIINTLLLQMKFAAALIATVSANTYENMNEDDLLVNLESTLSSALSSEARGDADAAVAKTAAIKNIQKALTARILKRLDDGHRGHAAPDQRYGAPPRYHAVGRARPRERHQDPPEGRRCPRHGQEVSNHGTAICLPRPPARATCRDLVKGTPNLARRGTGSFVQLNGRLARAIVE